MSFLTTSRAGLEMLLGLDDLRFLEDVHAAGEALQRLGDLLGLDRREHRAQFSGDTLLSR